MVETDQKILQMITLKNLTALTPYLHRMLLHLQQYDATIRYRPGSEMKLQNALSRLSSIRHNKILNLKRDKILNLNVDHIAFSDTRLA